MHRMLPSRISLAVIFSVMPLLATWCASAQSGASFQGLGDLPGGSFWSSATAVSADGSVVVGASMVTGNAFMAFRWSSVDGLQPLGNLPGPAKYSFANGVSANGSVIVGESDIGIDPFRTQAFRWTAADGMVALAHLAPGSAGNLDRMGAALATSGDGGVIVGYCDVDPPNASEDFAGALWTSPVSPLELAASVGGSWIQFAWDVSADGLVVVGNGGPVGPASNHAVRWTATGGPLFLQWIPGQGHQTYFTSISADGQIAAGTGHNVAGFPEAVSWTALGSFQPLGILSGATQSFATGISGDGSKIVGYCEFPRRAFIWDAANNMRDLKALLISEGLNLAGWTLQYAGAISDDGSTIVGMGINPSGQTEAWVARLPSPDTDGDGLSDDWEINGIPYVDSFGAEQRYILSFDGDITPDCDPNRKDIFVEVDSMVGFTPAPEVFVPVVNAFANAPVSNPNGAPSGIKLHVILDENTIPVGAWTQDDTNGNSTPDWPTEFDALKLSATSGTTLTGYFGTHIERNDPDGAALRNARKQAFRYCIFGRSLDSTATTTGPSGIAEIGGNDFAVTVGLWAGGGTNDEKAGTFMHELGHTLGLRHGGADNIRYKPNYYSVMNYAYQMPAPWMSTGSWPLHANRPGYSTFSLPTLNENALNECAAQVTPVSALAGTIFISSYVDGETVHEWFGRYDIATDWNNSGDDCKDPIANDINRLPIETGLPAPPGSPGEILTGHDDWAALIYNFRTQPSFADGVHNSELGESAVIEITYEEYQAMATMLPAFCGGDINNDRTVNVNDLLSVINQWGPCPEGCLSDITPLPADGIVNVNDLLAVINAWGPCP